jgi:hypothetical protein
MINLLVILVCLIIIEKVEESDEEYEPEQVESEDQVESKELKETRRLIMLEEGDECSLEHESSVDNINEEELENECETNKDIVDKDKGINDEKAKDEELMNDIEQKEVPVMDKDIILGTLQSNVEIVGDDNNEEGKSNTKNS